jgi:hypothetical protein
MKTPKQNFIDTRIGAGCSREDAEFLADLEFTEAGEIRPGSIYEHCLGVQ